jgi:hypothetical protein
MGRLFLMNISDEYILDVIRINPFDDAIGEKGDQFNFLVGQINPFTYYHSPSVALIFCED